MDWTEHNTHPIIAAGVAEEDLTIRAVGEGLGHSGSSIAAAFHKLFPLLLLALLLFPLLLIDNTESGYNALPGRTGT